VRGILKLSLFIIFLITSGYLLFSSPQEAKRAESGTTLLKLLNIAPSPESIDFVQNKIQFQLQSLPTEQGHEATRDLSQMLQRDIESGLQTLLDRARDMAALLNELALQPRILNRLVQAFERALLNGNTIYIHGGGQAGSVAVNMECLFWRPFWNRLKKSGRIWKRIQTELNPSVESQLIGEMAGGDPALFGGLEGLDDLSLIGWLQLQERNIKKGDVVVGLTAGGDTSSTIGTLLAALDVWKNEEAYDPEAANKNLFFFCNNPEEPLLDLDRSRGVLEEPGITKINLFASPPSLAGSTGMEAATLDTFVLGQVLQTAIHRTLSQFLNKKDLALLGFEERFDLPEKLRQFSSLVKKIDDQLTSLIHLIRAEAAAYASGRSVTHMAGKGLLPLLVNARMRIYDFHFQSLDTVEAQGRKAQTRLWAAAGSQEEAWQVLFQRPARGINSSHYKKSVSDVVADPFLKKASLEALGKADVDPSSLYDFSFAAFNLTNRGPQNNDLGICVLMTPEEENLSEDGSFFRRFIRLFSEQNRHFLLFMITDRPLKDIKMLVESIPAAQRKSLEGQIVVPIGTANDPFGVGQQVALKMLQDIQTTAVMAGLGRIVGNSLTHLRPASLKLIGRATFLIQSHVNETLSRPQWVAKQGLLKPISFGEANVVLYENIKFIKANADRSGGTSEVALSIIQILESLRQRRGLTQEEALAIAREKGLANYLSEFAADRRLR
jgi:N-acetylmuramic acid 6-phosphate etherase